MMVIIGPANGAGLDVDTGAAVIVTHVPRAAVFHYQRIAVRTAQRLATIDASPAEINPNRLSARPKTKLDPP